MLEAEPEPEEAERPKDYRAELRELPETAVKNIAAEQERVNDSWLAAYKTRVAEAAGKLMFAAQEGQITPEEHAQASQMLDALVKRVDEISPRYLNHQGDLPDPLRLELLGRLDLLFGLDEEEVA